MPHDVQEPMRHFGAAGRGLIYVKKATPTADGHANVHILLEGTGIQRALFCLPDHVFVSGGPVSDRSLGWSMTLSPAPTHDPDDGEGLPFVGLATGNVGKLKDGEQIHEFSYVRRPRFGEACDLYAVGMLLFESLLSHDERPLDRLRQAILTDLEELTGACLAVEPERRGLAAVEWITARCENDTPGAIWSRRNLLYRREERAASRLDGFPPRLWQAIIALGLRLTTTIPGFSFCDDRASDAPRLAGRHLVPLAEARGLVAMLDDLIFGRSGRISRLRAVIGGGER
ncbi:MAG TPA: hypothetical protein DEB56_09540 [Thiobacillus sp.]|nr:hypothetical protein [Thiobacillus sp.]